MWMLFIPLFSYTSAIEPPYIHVGNRDEGRWIDGLTTMTGLGISRGMIAVPVPKFTNPVPSGNEIHNRNQVCDSPAVPMVWGRNIGFNHEGMVPLPG